MIPRLPPCDIRIVSLVRATGRRARLKARPDALDLSHPFVDALDGTTAAKAEIYDGICKEGPWGWISPGDAACTQSHRRVWRAFLATEATHTLIPEDDVLLSDRLPELLSDMSWWPRGADVVKLERWKSKRLKNLLGNAIPVGRNLALRPSRSRHPGGSTLRRQKIRRGRAELRGGLARLPALLAGRITLMRLPLAPDLVEIGRDHTTTDTRTD